MQRPRSCHATATRPTRDRHATDTRPTDTRHPPAAKVLRDADNPTGAPLLCSPKFGVAVTSTFKADGYEALLDGSLPLSTLQPVDIFVPSEAARARALAAEGPTNSGPLSGVLSDWGGAWSSTPARSKGDAPKAGQLQGDRTSLFLSN